ncbi:PhnD/SsuA/transferrin family substrate-binding protein [Roseimicrobium sp. ORNL1]|uniref:phosphate/phosphite/phosphonate ABC transporter substrate-binding protein n=1 Tax=Roseimicrobium sp. ORNL1 TaxID=2711231 RepID=UPI0013E119DC|nr:PhnD/SsuA/transferrin family substrate-binding protein [Roseimicrobium sp. ORNL1]QIF02017.1 phosphate/phosphite/phosphonate ABC transporter substrate-binding protein [Roseimicrobium sp. ORNL1]
MRISYYPDITQHRTPEEVRTAVVTFAEALARQMTQLRGSDVAIDVLPVVSVAEQTAMIAEGRCEIALIKPSSYVLAHRRNARVLPAAVALRVIDGTPGDRYFAQLYCHVDSGFRSLDDVAARCRLPEPKDRPSIGFGDPFSTANFLVPAAHLADKGLFPFTRFRRSEYFGGHDGVVRAVYARSVDIGAGHDGVIVDLARQPGFADAAEKLIRLDRVFIHSDPVAVLVDDATRAQLTESMVTIAARPEIKHALDVFWGAVVGLAPTTHENYASVEHAITRLGIPENDLLV